MDDASLKQLVLRAFPKSRRAIASDRLSLPIDNLSFGFLESVGVPREEVLGLFVTIGDDVVTSSVGTLPGEYPIAVGEECVVVLDSNRNGEVWYKSTQDIDLFVNSGIKQFLGSLAAFREYEIEIQGVPIEDDQPVVNRLESRLSSIDPCVLLRWETWWFLIVEQVRLGQM